MSHLTFKVMGLVSACFTLFVAIQAQKQDDSLTWRILLGGDTQGYLSPCGCVKPMSGGVRRRLTAMRETQSRGQTLTLELGGFSAGTGRQNELKLETLSEVLNLGKVDAIGLSADDLKLEEGVLGSIQRLSGYKLLATDATVIANEELPRFMEKGPFLVGSVANPDTPNGKQAIQELVSLSLELRKNPILLIGSGLAQARNIAKANQHLKVIVYRLAGTPPRAIDYEGSVVLVTPGDKGRHVTELIWNDRVTSATLLELNPSIEDDPDAQRIYSSYLNRVESEKLLEQVPRTQITQYSGSDSCKSCHATEYKIWSSSKHAIALQTLENDGHDRDPDCVGCHVVGLESIKGFVSREKTPQLSNVGCESCHGSAVEHTVKPMVNKMPTVTPQSCQTCHNLNHSPSFQYKSFWEKIKH